MSESFGCVKALNLKTRLADFLMTQLKHGDLLNTVGRGRIRSWQINGKT